MSTQVSKTKQERRAKYTKKEAKKRTFKWKAKEDMLIFQCEGTDKLMFKKGKIYDMHVKNMYSYTTESELDSNTFITREFLNRHFEEVSK